MNTPIRLLRPLLLAALILAATAGVGVRAQSPTLPAEAFGVSASAEGMIVDPAGEGMDMRRYSDCPVSYASGTVAVNIPLIGFKCGDLSMSLGLSYHTGGIKANQTAGYVGLGWALTGLGQITRQVVGYPDDYHGSTSDVRLMTDPADYDKQYVQGILDGKIDSHRDIFTYNFPSGSGSFFVKGNAVIHLGETALKISVNRDSVGSCHEILSFSILTPDGIRYEFDAREWARFSAQTFSNDHETSNHSYAYTSAWHLTKITSAGDNDPITIKYTEGVQWTRVTGGRENCKTLVFEDYELAREEPLDNFSIRSLYKFTQNPLVPSAISSRTASVEFDTHRFASELDEIKSPETFLSAIRLINPQGSTVRKVSFGYSDTIRLDNYYPQDNNLRVLLRNIKVHAGDTLVDRRVFAYTSPDQKSKQTDVFGYSNGCIFIGPAHVVNPDGSATFTRKSSRESGSHLLLSGIKDALGTTTRFFYEPKAFPVKYPGGATDTIFIGQRIASVTTTDAGTGRFRKRAFTYSGAVINNDVTMLDINSWAGLAGIREWILRPDGKYANRNTLTATLTRSARALGAPLESTEIFYSSVSEYISGTGIDYPLLTTYEYDLQPVINKVVKTPVNNPNPSSSPTGRFMGLFNLPDNDTLDVRSLKTLFSPKPVNRYICKTYNTRPLLVKTVRYEWYGSAYLPYETVTNHWSCKYASNYLVGTHCESLVYRTLVKDTYKDVVSNPSTDVSAFNTHASYQTWLCDSVITRRHYPDGNHRDVRQVMTYSRLPGVSLPASDNSWERSSPNLPYQLLHTTLSCGRSSIVHSVLLTGNLYSSDYDDIRQSGHLSLPVRDRWIAGRDTLDTSTSYMLVNGAPRVARRTVSYNRREPISQETFISYDSCGHPLVGFDANHVLRRWEWDKYDGLEREYLGGSLAVAYRSIPLVGTTFMQRASGLLRNYSYAGGRVVSESNASHTLSQWRYGLYSSYGENFVEQRSLSGDNSWNTLRRSFDGFGQPWLTSFSNSSASAPDLYQATCYDAIGRPLASTVPTTAGLKPADYRTVLDEAVSARGNAFPALRNEYPGNHDSSPSAVYEPGVPDSAAPITTRRLCNNSSPKLRCLDLRFSDFWLDNNGYFPPGMLDVTSVTDADMCETLVFTDWRGLKIMERRVLSDQEFIDTYYIYDSMARLQVVLMPGHVARKTQTYGREPFYSSTLTDNSYLYLYDRNGRLAEKRAPGAGTVLYRYDSLGRVAFTQDSEQKADGQCRFFFYDNLGREAVNGLCDDSFMPEKDHTSPPMVVYLSSSSDGIDGSRYTTSAFPDFKGTLLSASYYDNSDYLSVDGFADLPDFQQSGVRKGLRVASMERVLVPRSVRPSNPGDPVIPGFIHRAYFYDEEERLRQVSYSTSRVGEYVTEQAQYDAAGHPVYLRNTLHQPDGNTVSSILAITYDSHGRPVQRSIALGNSFCTFEQCNYDYFGNLRLSRGVAGNVNYDYDINSRRVLTNAYGFSEKLQLSGAGRIVTRNTTTPDIGSQTRRYSYDGAGRLIAVSSPGHTTPDSPASPDAWEATYTRDRNSNLTAVTRTVFEQPFIGAISPGQQSGSYTLVDRLSLEYSGNRLRKVTDLTSGAMSADNFDFVDGADDDTEYTYDLNGRLTSDLNRGISSLSWNEVSRPQRLDFDNDTWIKYAYSASGQKLEEQLGQTTTISLTSQVPGSSLSRVASPGGLVVVPPVLQGDHTISRRRYAGPFELVGDSVARINFPGGYWAGGKPHACVTDHQGNVRAVYTPKGTLVQRTDYFPYGAPSYCKNPETNSYLFAGKELDMQQGLNMAHHGARLYLPDLGYFASPDPLAELDPGVSPYTYCAGDPANFSDNTGLYKDFDMAVNVALAFGLADNAVGFDDDRQEWYVFKPYAYNNNNEPLMEKFFGSDGDVVTVTEIFNPDGSFYRTVKFSSYTSYGLSVPVSAGSLALSVNAVENANRAGNNFKWYRSGHISNAVDMGFIRNDMGFYRGLKAVNQSLGLVSIACSAYDFGNEWLSGGDLTSATIKLALDVSVTAIGMLCPGPIGIIVPFVYFLGSNIYQNYQNNKKR